MSEKRFNDPLTLEELTERTFELTEKVARLDAFIEGFREDIRQLRDEIAKLDAKIDRVRDELDAKIEKTRGELREEIRELRMVMIGGFVAVIAVSVLLKLLLG
jgi:predicted nuclease with TOPRIM domain